MDILEVIAQVARFYYHESCGQCTPCREGTGWLLRLMKKLAAYQGSERDLDTLSDVARQIENHTICALGDAAAWPIQGMLRHFRPEIEKRLRAFPRVNTH